jgi:signal transduction histidine kinase
VRSYASAPTEDVVIPPEARGEGRRFLGRSIALFMAAGLVTVAVIGAVGAEILQRLAIDEARRNARELALADARSLEPYFTDAAAAGDPTALSALDSAVRLRVISGRVVRVKLWAADGRVLYSDATSLIGRRFTLRADEADALRTGRVEAELSDLTLPENRLEQPYDPVFEVFLGVRTASGQPMLFEMYHRFDAVAADSRTLLRSFAPALVGGLLTLWLAQLPLALGLSRRLRARDERERELLVRAIESSSQERRRIAADLHDTVVQGLAGTSLGLAGLAQEAREAEVPDLAATVDGHAADLRQWVRELRTMVVSIAPAGLSEHGLLASLDDVASTLRSRGVDVTLDAPADLSLSRSAEALLFRTAQEGVRNIAKHAGAQHVAVAVSASAGRARLTITDDGAGFAPHTRDQRQAQGHLGLYLLEELARDCRGSLAVTSTPGQGTTLVLELPVA